MAWTTSKPFVATLEDILENRTAVDLDTDTFKTPLFDNTITPSQTVASASTAYGAGVWAGGAVSDAVSWPAVGINLSGVSSGFSSNVFTWDASDTTSNDSTTDLTNATGTNIYDDTIAAPVADQGLVYIYFGGAQTVVNGTFTIVWNGSGILAYTL